MSIQDWGREISSMKDEIMNQTPESEWLKTVSGRIYKRLQKYSKEMNIPLSIENQGGVHELYHVGNETAQLYKRLLDGTVGENGGTIRTLAEGWEYKKYPWWKLAMSPGRASADLFGNVCCQSSLGCWN